MNGGLYAPLSFFRNYIRTISRKEAKAEWKKVKSGG